MNRENDHHARLHAMRGSTALWLLCASLLLPTRAEADDLVDLLPSLYGGDGIVLGVSGPFDHSAHFTGISLAELSAFSDGITSSINFASLNSSVTGFTFDLELGVPVQTQESLGPLLGERASTLGARKLNVAFNYTRVDYDRFEGDKLSQLRLVFPHEDTFPGPDGDGVIGAPPGGGPDFEVDTIVVDVDIDLEQDVWALFGTYGLLPRLDVGIVVPIIHSSLRADAVGRIVESNNCCPGIHQFDPDPLTDPPQDDPRSSVRGSATGIGDVLLRAKYHLPHPDRAWMPETAVLFQIKTPSGDEDELLGTGDTRLTPMFIADHRFGPVSPHVNFGFEFVPGHSSRQAFKVLAGLDVRAHERVTLASDFLGRFEPDGDGIGDDLLDVSVGAKVNVWKSLLVVGNTVLPLNRNHGLRADVIWSLGLEYTFGAGD